MEEAAAMCTPELLDRLIEQEERASSASISACSSSPAHSGQAGSCL
jgi:hypothetical protein